MLSPSVPWKVLNLDMDSTVLIVMIILVHWCRHTVYAWLWFVPYDIGFYYK